MKPRYAIVRDAYGRALQRWAVDGDRFTINLAEAEASIGDADEDLIVVGFPRQDVFEWDAKAFDDLSRGTADWDVLRDRLARFDSES